MGALLEVACECGYQAEDELVLGLVMSGAVFELFVCTSCREVICAETSIRLSDLQESATRPECPLCRGRELTIWSEDDMRGPCPRCGRHITAQAVGIAD
jgi:hypothetical protein